MAITTDFPGDYVEQQKRQRFSVCHCATAVPAFAISAQAAQGLGLASGTKRIENYLEYSKYTADLDGTHTAMLDRCLRAYFNNGGASCYLIQTDNLVEEVVKHDDITLLVAAGESLAGAVELLENDNNLFAIVDGPKGELVSGDTLPWDKLANSSFSAAYYPWLIADWTDAPIPPSAVIAGAYCRNDSTRGVWKAPANMALVGVKPQFQVSDAMQGQYTRGTALNMIRRFNNGAPTIWGARTQRDSLEWRYVPVRRLCNSIEKDIKEALRAMIFEPNTQPTWDAVSDSVEQYLTQLWLQGALMGASAEEAFFINVGENITMSQSDIVNGKMIIDIGVAIMRPAEFIVIQFRQDTASYLKK
ncbi:hypothetical protein EDC56_1086 [Sinobacterium caligoides]|uniref:Tail sheath protein C-terminal domain-containing protein n=1 Tax=Sinobacterium caligoides TaxID=933926 RepID=A0A3N2E0B7_9GAMM|nr:phage tail sheath C-terminal domain-containing protein [Sinobacterium caligoides]ROS05551.1 hypothetical protein EDC56_1086 [Sinobacterium caligoides]